MAPSIKELFGDLKPVPVDQLANDEEIYKKLTVSGSPFEIEEKYIDGRLQKVYKDLPSTLKQFWLTVSSTFADRTYIVYEDQKYTYKDIFLESVKLSNVLYSKFNIRKGDRVGIASRNYVEFVISFWASHLVGSIVAILNSFHDGETLAFSIEDVQCKVVICDGERFERVKEKIPTFMKRSNPSFEGLLVMPWMGVKRVESVEQKSWKQWKGKGSEKVFDWQELMDSKNISQEVPNVQIQPDDDGVILFTSGTTGKPKGVLSTQRQHLSCLRLATWTNARALLRRHRALPPPLDVNDPDPPSVLIMVPLTHTTGLQSGLVLCTAVGGKAVLMPTYSRSRSIELAKRENVRTILGIGFMVREIGMESDQNNLPNLSAISHGGSLAAKELPAELNKKFPNAYLSAGYGLTEINGVGCGISVDDYHARPSSAGTPPAGVEVIIVDPVKMTRITEIDTRGELWIRTPGRAKGYWNREKDNREAFLQDGWFRSGDLATIDKDGFVFIVDRLKDIIVRKGENISCATVENAVYTHENILHCCAVGLPDGQGGEKVAIVCTPKDLKNPPTQQQIIDQSSKHLPKYAIPEFVWIRTDSELERNANGKIVRNQVKKSLLEYINKNQKSKL